MKAYAQIMEEAERALEANNESLRGQIIALTEERRANVARIAELEAAMEFLLGELDGLEGTIGTFSDKWAQVARNQARAALAK